VRIARGRCAATATEKHCCEWHPRGSKMTKEEGESRQAQNSVFRKGRITKEVAKGVARQ
jgi:hypothetical protein